MHAVSSNTIQSALAERAASTRRRIADIKHRIQMLQAELTQKGNDYSHALEEREAAEQELRDLEADLKSLKRGQRYND